MLEGSCLCGKIRYRLSAPPLFMYYCHCGTCRKATGSAFATNILVAAEHFELLSGNDHLDSFESSPNKHRHFCRGCGSPLYSRAQATSHILSVRCGTLDGDPGLRPAVHAYVSDKAPWDEIGDDLPQKPEGFS